MPNRAPRKCDQCLAVYIPNSNIQKRCSKECSAKALKELKKSPAYVKQEKKRRKRPEVKEMLKANAKRYYSTPKGKTRKKNYQKNYKRSFTPEQLAQRKKKNQEWWQSKQGRNFDKKRRATPEHKEYQRNYQLDRYHKVGGRRGRKHLITLIEQQKNLCGICKKQLPKNLSLIHVDHILQVHQGGGDEIENLRATHAKCNLRRSKNDHPESPITAAL